MPPVSTSEANQHTLSQKKWWQQDGADPEKVVRSRAGQPCPKCLLGDLDFDSLFRLQCPNCGYVADCGAFT